MNKITIINGEKNFEIQFDSATIALLTIFDKYESKYDKLKKSWSFEKNHYEAVLTDLKEIAIIEKKTAEVEVFQKHIYATKKINIRMSKFNQDIIDITKTIKGRKYFQETKEWEIDDKYVDELKEKLATFKVTDVV